MQKFHRPRSGGAPVRHRYRRSLLGVGTAVIIAAVAAGCGSSSKSSTSATTAGGSTAATSSAAASSTTSTGTLSAAMVSTLKAALAAGAAPVHWEAGGPAFKVTGVAGKTVFMLLDGSENQFEESFVSGVKAASEAAGMKFTEGNGNSVISQDDQLLENAITAHVAAIMLSAQTPSTLTVGLQKAKAAGIPVIESFIGNPHAPTAAEEAIGVSADATYCYSCTGLLSAEYQILKTGGKVDSMVQQYPGSPPSDATAAGWKQGIEEFCPKTCKITYTNVSLSGNTVQEIQSGTQVAAQNKSINTIFPVYDYQMGYMLPEIQAANAAGRISLLSENADLAQMQEMADGTAVKVDVGNPVAWDGWSAVDQMLRVLDKLPPSANEEVPVRLFDVDNVKALDLKANPATWYGGADYEADYKTLWGIS